MGWFKKADLDTHRNYVEEWIRSDEKPTFTTAQFDALLEIADTEEWQKRFRRIVTVYYSISYSFYQADTRFQLSIPKYINLFDGDSLIYLVEQIDSNRQCYAR